MSGECEECGETALECLCFSDRNIKISIDNSEFALIPSAFIPMNKRRPHCVMRVVFLSRQGITEDKIGLAIPETQCILLRRTDISFDDVTHWFPFPEVRDL